MAAGEEILLEAQLQREAAEDLHRHLPIGALEGQHLVPEARDRVGLGPEIVHPGPRDLVAFLLVRRAGGGADLRLELPARIGAGAQRQGGLGLLRQGEERLRQGEGLLDLLQRDAVAGQLEEAERRGRLPQLVRDLGLRVS
jgi:hypothetical protein